jgi:hypothetical protein
VEATIRFASFQRTSLLMHIGFRLGTMSHSPGRKRREQLRRRVGQPVRFDGSGKRKRILLHYQDKVVIISGQHEEVLVVRGDGILERHYTLNLGFPLGLEFNNLQAIWDCQNH